MGTRSRQVLLGIWCICGMATAGFGQIENYYTLDQGAVLKKKFKNVRHEIKFESNSPVAEEALSIAWGGLAARLIPLLVDGASKLFYNPDNFNKEYFANHSFFDASGRFRKLDPTSTLIFEHSGETLGGQRERINRFEFELGRVSNVEGYYYIGLKGYDIAYSWSKLSSANNGMNYIIDIGFYYFDESDKAQEFHINPLLLDARVVGASAATIENVNYQVIPKMKVLQIIQIRVREINAKKQNWDRYLDLYQSNQDNISKFLIRALFN